MIQHEGTQDSDSEVVRKRHRVSAQFKPTSRKTQIARSAREQRLQGLCRKRTDDAVPRIENFGDLITADHEVLNEKGDSRNNHRHAVVGQDLATQRIQSYPCKTKPAPETHRSSRKFLEPSRKPRVISTDNSLDFGKSCDDLLWNHCTSTLHRSETDGIAERAVRRIKKGTSAVLRQSGLDEKWWADFMECYCYLRNVEDILAGVKTLCGRACRRTHSQIH